ncbi:MAG: hypothetical protein JGK17_22415 [Microcoleus sp. PH2017_10_PVI_O_A]|uniref:hypothetical protein n=1 Tax=unclassified Microcoleus TaxID=2642155 RepID=UPI001D2DA209|nr:MULTISPECIES: hypothetical protein [unclassified Microcoleus]MCC3408293.1 hypothetical protein [Microcoleus sp. PH2017_10_PVI_O_A]MCC3462471.1 hypothetical protein [Microcoleus sp. PH2017_11_PCY_U_A]MCC3480840.1 hypothetical protein [Microcoleus sp. PH2017_12_PCY_D_A]MCC3531070.1 hypothetical protein [Microcoleus sp. PH2017_21_RUC_O_A]MCC3543418.1 hypothetical protein [Microcoleus sp. PH2017_22_RUC_O_B]
MSLPTLNVRSAFNVNDNQRYRTKLDCAGDRIALYALTLALDYLWLLQSGCCFQGRIVTNKDDRP